MYTDILVPTDGSQPALAAARYAAAIAERLGATVHVLSVVDIGSYSDQLADIDPAVRAQKDHLESRARDAVQSVEERIGEDFAIEQTASVEHGVPYAAITDYAASNGMDLVILGTHGRSGVDRLLLGSVAERVIRTSEVPAIAVPRAAEATDRPSIDTVLIPTDGSAAAEAAAKHGLTLADRHSATVHVLTVVRSGGPLSGGDDTQTAEAAVDRVAETATDLDVTVRTHVQTGSPVESIMEFTQTNGIDLVAMGTGNRSGVARHLLGSVAESVVRQSEAPVLTTRGGQAPEEG